MTKKSFIVILVLSVITSYVADIVDAVLNNTLLGGSSGFPFTDSHGTIFGEGTINNYMVVLNIAFWFTVIFLVWKILLRVLRK